MLERSSIVNIHTIRRKYSDLGDYVFDSITNEWEHQPTFTGGQMTACIAALCENYKTIITATDKMITSDFTAADTNIVKIQPVAINWATMFAGADATPIEDIVRAATKRLRDGKEKPVEEARTNVAQAYREVRLQRAEAQFLSSRGWTLDKFKAEGLKLLGDLVFSQIERRIHEVDLGVYLLVAGHYRGTGHIFSVENPGIDEARAIPGFHAIGSGSFNALSCLYQRNVNPNMFLTKTLYYVYEAMKYAQKAGGVGEKVDIWLIRENKKQQVSKKVHDELENIWHKLKPRDANVNRLKKLDKIDEIDQFRA